METEALSTESEEVFDLLATYFTYTYYNTLYVVAKESCESGSKGALTNYFAFSIKKYHDESITIDGVRNIIKDIYDYAMLKGYHTSYTDFINRIIKQFTTPEHYKCFRMQKKDYLIAKIIIDIINDFTIIIRNNLQLIIDERNNQNISMIKSYGINKLIEMRSRLIYKFDIAGKKPKNIDGMPYDLYEKITEEKNKLVEKYKDLLLVKTKQDHQIKKLNSTIRNQQIQMQQLFIQQRQQLNQTDRFITKPSSNLISNSVLNNEKKKRVVFDNVENNIEKEISELENKEKQDTIIDIDNINENNINNNIDFDIDNLSNNKVDNENNVNNIDNTNNNENEGNEENEEIEKNIDDINSEFININIGERTNKNFNDIIENNSDDDISLPKK